MQYLSGWCQLGTAQRAWGAADVLEESILLVGWRGRSHVHHLLPLKKQIGGSGFVALVIEHDMTLINNSTSQETHAAEAAEENLEIQGLGSLWGAKDYRLPNQRAHARGPACCMLSQVLCTVA
jgi:hypothetical protein